MIPEYRLLRPSLNILSLMVATKSSIIQRCHNICNLGAASLDVTISQTMDTQNRRVLFRIEHFEYFWCIEMDIQVERPSEFESFEYFVCSKAQNQLDLHEHRVKVRVTLKGKSFPQVRKYVSILVLVHQRYSKYSTRKDTFRFWVSISMYQKVFKIFSAQERLK